MEITSPAFKNGEIIPVRYTCEGEEFNPPLHFRDVPKTAKSLVLIIEDPDVPKSLRKDGMWDHWVLFNISPSVQTIEENSTPQCGVGKNTSGVPCYEGPCPPDRKHRYFFKLFALDIMLGSCSSKKEVEAAMQGHIIAKAELIGLYEKGIWKAT